MKGREIQSVTEIIELAYNKKCIWHDGLNTRIPAAIIQNWQLIRVIQALRKGLLFHYIPKKKKEFYENIKQK